MGHKLCDYDDLVFNWKCRKYSGLVPIPKVTSIQALSQHQLHNSNVICTGNYLQSFEEAVVVPY